MNSIRVAFNLLNEKQQALMRYAAVNGISQHVEYLPGRFIGYDAQRITYLNVEYVEGRWSTGTINAVLHESASSQS